MELSPKKNNLVPKICIVTSSLNAGGVESYILRLVSFLSKHNIQIDVLTVEEKGIWFDKIYDLGQRSVHIRGARTSNPLVHSWRVGNYLQKNDYDLIFLNNERYCQAALSMIPQRTIAIPILHSIGQYCFDIAKINSCLWNISVGVSQGVCELARQHLPGKEVIYIPNGIEINEVLPTMPPPIPGLTILIFVGRLCEEKGVRFLPEIISRCMDRKINAHLTVVGDGPERSRLESTLIERGLGTSVQFTGVLSHTQVIERLRRSHILLLPSLYEGLPGVLIEALANGCVPMATRIEGSTTTIINHGKTGFLMDYGDVVTYVNNINALSQDSDLWFSMRQKGYADMKKEFSISVTGKKYLELIHNACNGQYQITKKRRRLCPVDLKAFTIKEITPYFLKICYRGLKRLLRISQV